MMTRARELGELSENVVDREEKENDIHFECNLDTEKF